MEYLVNERCIGCGLCASICPEAFLMNQEGLAYVKKQPEEGVICAKADEALAGCPVEAIEKH